MKGVISRVLLVYVHAVMQTMKMVNLIDGLEKIERCTDEEVHH